MNERDKRITRLRRQPILTFSQVHELDILLYEQQQEEQGRVAKEAREREMRQSGKQVFVLRYKRGTVFQSSEDMAEVVREVWANDPTEAAEISCRFMLGQESLLDPTGVHITDAASCRLDTFKGDQRQLHDPIWVNPYGIAPSQQSDGGPIGFAQDIIRAITGKNMEVIDGSVYLTD